MTPRKQAPRSRGQIIPKGERKWLVRMYLGRVNGKRQYHAETVSGTFKQAEQVLTRLLNGKDTQTFVQPSKQRLMDFLPAWLATKGDIGAGCRRSYTQHITDYILPALGWITLSGLTPQRVRDFYGSLVSDHKLSPRTARLTHVVLRGALQQAVEDGLILRNPCDQAKKALPRKPQHGAGQALTLEQTAHVLSQAQGTRLGALWHFVLTTGMRPQEWRALRWADLTPDGAVLVQRAWKTLADGSEELSNDLKTEKSRRRVELSQALVQDLQDHRQRQLKEMLKAGPAYQRHDFIFAMKDGRPMSMTTARYQWKRLMQRCGLSSGLRLYDARHTHLTHALQVLHPKAVADRSGHSNPNVLLNTYAHTLPSLAKAAPEAIEEMLSHARVAPSVVVPEDRRPVRPLAGRAEGREVGLDTGT